MSEPQPRNIATEIIMSNRAVGQRCPMGTPYKSPGCSQTC